MQAAASRSAPSGRRGRRDKLSADPHHNGGDDTGLLDALPIAASVIEQGADGALIVAAHNSRFAELVERSTCTALDWNEADCLKSGRIADLLSAFFDGSDTVGELDAVHREDVVSGRLAELFASRALVSEDAGVDEQPVAEHRRLEAKQIRMSVCGKMIRSDIAGINEKKSTIAAMDEVIAVPIADRRAALN